VSIPTLLDPDLAPAGHHIIHTLRLAGLQIAGFSSSEYEQKKELLLGASLSG